MSAAQVLPVYNRTKFAIERGEGVYAYTSDNRKMLDFASGIAVNSLGHCHPHLVEALKKQAEILWHTSNLYNAPGQQKLAERLIANSFADTAFFCNSGAEAVECGIKMVRKYFDETGKPEKYRIITIEGAFHGRTMATIAAGGNQKYISGFEPMIDGFDHISWADAHNIRAKITPFTAAILVEPVLGEGGIKAIPLECLKGVRKLCDEFGLLLFLDEVQCGMGRTGKLFAHEWAEIKPDIVATAKGIGGGFPLGACLATEEAAKGMKAGSHGSTYGGNPLAMAVGNAVLDVMLAEGFMQKVQDVSAYLRKALDGLMQKYPAKILSIRGKGLLTGFELVADIINTDFVNKLRENELLTVSAAENVVRLVPPLIIEQQHVDEAISKIEKALA